MKFYYRKSLVESIVSVLGAIVVTRSLYGLKLKVGNAIYIFSYNRFYGSPNRLDFLGYTIRN